MLEKKLLVKLPFEHDTAPDSILETTHSIARAVLSIGVADACVVDLDSDFVCLWWCDLNVFECEVLSSLPGHGGLASDGFAFC